MGANEPREIGDERPERGGVARAAMARLYADARSGGSRATPIPPEGAAGGRPARDHALAPPWASHGDTARHTARVTPPRLGPRRAAVTVFCEAH